MLEAQLEREMGVLTVERDQSHSLENLKIFSMFLDRHVRHISEALQVVKAKGHTRWPAKTDVCEISESAAKSIEEDFEELWERALDLRRRCSEGMGVMMNRAVIAESRKAIGQAERLKRLTLLATFFIPLSFTTSLFGMISRSSVKVTYPLGSLLTSRRRSSSCPTVRMYGMIGSA